MPYLTPDSIPEGDTCRPLSIPADATWLALFSGALTELTKPYNWEKFGALTVQETVDKMQAIIDNYYAGACGCTTPGGYRIIRINTTTGALEQLVGDEWVEATDEYEIPPPEAREGGTEDEQICLAATNAVNVLETLYDSLSDSFGAELSEAAALVAFIASAVAIVGFAFAPITFGIAALAFWFFEWLYQGLSYLTADLWDDTFSETLICFLKTCATNTAGVITFDWQCFNDQLNSLANPLALTEVQTRLYLQVGFILQFIGGAAGLNLAGGTTELSEGNCDACGAHCHYFDFTVTDGDFIPGYPDFAPPAAYISDWVTGEGWSPSGSPAIYNGFYIDFNPVDISQLTVHWVGGDMSMGACGNISIELYLGGVQQAVVSTDQSWQTTGTLQIVGAYTGDRIIVSGNNCPNTGWTFDWLEVSYAGEQVFGEDNCP